MLTRRSAKRSSTSPIKSPSKEIKKKQRKSPEIEDEDSSDDEFLVPKRRTRSTKRPSTSPVKPPVQKLLKKSKNDSDANGDQKPSKAENEGLKDDAGSSSDSSIDDYLVPADKIDLDSTFFSSAASKDTGFESVEKSIFESTGRLSDEDSEDETRPNSSEAGKEELHAHIEQLNDYNRKLEEAKIQVKKYEVRKSEAENKLDIAHMLAVGETKRNSQDETVHFTSESEEDHEWEEVEENQAPLKEPEPTLSVSKDVEITVRLPQLMKTKKGIDLMAAMKRRINRIKKETQVYMHKVHLLCWIAHGNYISSILNSEALLGAALSLLPSENAYPPKHANLKYLEQIVNWYSRTVKYSNNPVHNKSLVESLQKEIKEKHAVSIEHYVYIFVCMLRSLGLQCRLVLSFQCVPLRPPSSELCSLSTKEKDPPKTSKKPNLKKLKNEPSTSHITEEVESTGKSHKSEKKESKSAKESHKPEKKESKSAKDSHKPEKKESRSAKEPHKDEVKESNNKPNLRKLRDRSAETNNNAKSQPRKTSKKPNISKLKIPQLDGASDSESDAPKPEKKRSKKPNISKLKVNSVAGSSKKTTESNKPNQKNRNTSKTNDTAEKQKSPNTNKTKTNDAAEKQKRPTLQTKKHQKNLKTQEKKKAKKSRKRQVESSGSESRYFTDSPKKLSGFQKDIVNIVKNSMVKEKRLAQSKRVRSVPKYQSEESDSDYMPESPSPSKSKSKKVDSEDEFDVKSETKVKKRIAWKKGQNEVENDEGKDKPAKKGIDIWVEVFLEEEEKWISVDVVKAQVHCVAELRTRASQPVAYIVAWNNDQSLKDVTKRYCPQWNTVTRKLRVDSIWWEETLKPYLGPNTARNREEDEDLARQQLEQPLPKTISEYKNHPLYALKRHLLKYEAIYPPDSVTLGFVRNEPVYARECVHTLHSRPVWLKEAKVVKLGEKPYKIVKALPKYDKLSGTVITDIPLEIFGSWQVSDYIPPVAENGIVPRNAYGNVELFKMSMLPKGTVHLQLPGLNKVARKLQIDCAPAVVGFDFHSGGNHPTFDGYVVCEEFKELLIAAWFKEQEEAERRAQEKLEKRVYGNWRRLIKGLLIRERLKIRYDFGSPSQAEDKGKKKSKGPKVVPKKRRIQSDSDSDWAE